MNNYDFKDAFMVFKAVADKATEIYKSKSDTIVNQLLKLTNNQYRSDYGLFNLKTNPEKTIKVYTEKEKEKIEKLQAQIDILQAQIDVLGTKKVVKDSYKSLVYRSNTTAEKEAEKLLKDLINTIGNASMKRVASKTQSKKANIK